MVDLSKEYPMAYGKGGNKSGGDKSIDPLQKQLTQAINNKRSARSLGESEYWARREADILAQMEGEDQLNWGGVEF